MGFYHFNTLKPKKNGCHFTDYVFKCIFLHENVWILLRSSLKFVPKVPINNILSLFQIMSWWWSGNKPLSEPMIVRLYVSLVLNKLKGLAWWLSGNKPLSEPMMVRLYVSLGLNKLKGLEELSALYITELKSIHVFLFHHEDWPQFTVCKKYPMENNVCSIIIKFTTESTQSAAYNPNW